MSQEPGAVHLLKEQYTTLFVSRYWFGGSLDLDSAQPDVWYDHGGHITNYRDGEREFIYLHVMNFKSSQWRYDGTRAPWEALDRVCRATVDDMENGIVIDASGVWPLPSTGP